jgi:mannose-6-phosphate isomerase-like protein (cupin superfamily)
LAEPPPAFRTDAGGGERLTFGEGTIIVRASGETTGGAFAVLEEVPPLRDTPKHVHANEDEMFYVLEGEHIVECGEEEFRLGPGDLVFLPRGVPHAQRRVVPGEGRFLVLASPPGLEGFFRELAAAGRDGTLGPEAYASASERYGITWLGQE